MIEYFKKNKFILITLFIFILSIVWFNLVSNGNYGTTLFFTIPNTISFLVGYVKKRENNLSNSKLKIGLRVFLIANLIILILCGILLLLGFEGVICILMAYPFLVIPMTLSFLLGAFIGHADGGIKRNALIALIIVNPCSYIFDAYSQPINQEVRTELIIFASKKDIWNNLTNEIKFSNTPQILFDKGVSYPKSIKFRRNNDIPYYECITNNDTIHLNISEVKKNNLISFVPSEQTIPMRELTPYNRIDAKHLNDYFYIHHGKIQLSAIDDDSTKITATTSYSYKIAPKWYWKLWSNYIINEMHTHVLNSVKISMYE